MNLYRYNQKDNQMISIVHVRVCKYICHIYIYNINIRLYISIYTHIPYGLLSTVYPVHPFPCIIPDPRS